MDDQDAVKQQRVEIRYVLATRPCGPGHPEGRMYNRTILLYEYFLDMYRERIAKYLNCV